MSRLAALLGVVVAALVLVRGPAEADDKGRLPVDLAQVPGKATAMISLRPAELWELEVAKGVRGKLGKEAEQVASSIGKEIGLPPAEMARITLVFNNIGPGAGADPLAFIAANKAVSREKLLGTLVPGGEEKTHAGKKYISNERRGLVLLDDRHYVFGPVGDIQSMLDAGKTGADEALMPALKLVAEKHSVVLAINPEKLEKLSDELPADAEPFKPLLQAKLGTLAIDAGPSVKAGLRLTFPGADAAKAGSKSLTIARKMTLGMIEQFATQSGKLPGWEPMVKLVQQAGKELEKARISQDGAVVQVGFSMKLDEKAVGQILGEGIAKARLAALRMQSANHLKQIGLAMHNYHDTYGHFPPAAIYDKDGKPLLSWRVLLLPFLEHDQLFKEFRLDEAWDSPHNKKLIARMPAVFRIPSAKTKHDHGTFYQVFYGKGAAFEGKTGNTIVSFTDGTSNTILAVEAEKDVPWSKPEDVPFDADKEVPALGNHHGSNGFQVLFADGSVRFLSQMVNKDNLKAMITRAGGEVINND